MKKKKILGVRYNGRAFNVSQAKVDGELVCASQISKGGSYTTVDGKWNF
jgi:3-hydroxymyristoyl/3-hydroxydecanoyl-(acyl carrier protein) dehydratase